MKYLYLLACPMCGGSFTQAGTALKCPRNHSFDVAREGYVNLLLKKLPGDTREMLLARRAFLEHGWYAPVAEAVNAVMGAHLPADLSEVAVLDAGCGEGYYTGKLLSRLLSTGCRDTSGISEVQ